MMEIVSFFQTIRWQDAVDIALASYILFRFYVLFRGTYVFRVISGLVLLWLFQQVTVSLGLIVTSWAIQGITAVAAFIIIVVFRNELRRVLQAKNIKAILWDFSQKPTQTPVEILVTSIFELMRRGIGALIVFPGKDDLDDYVQNGIAWNGRISKEMILSVFWHDNPVHDGAAVIRGDLVGEVGVVLPLSHRKDLPSYYGTRHRAAAGLAESSDALVVVVSEERESVVVARGTSVTEIHSHEELAGLLKEHTGQVTPGSEGQKNERTRLVLAALVSVVFISGIWFSFTRGQDTLITLDVPVEYRNRDSSMEIVSTSNDSVSIQLSGSGSLIRSIRPEQVQVRIDLSHAVIGENTFTIAHDNVTLPPGIVLKTVTPQTLKVALDVPMTKRLPIQVDWVGKLPEGLLLEKVRLAPETVEIRGSSLILMDVSTVYTQNAPLDALKETGTLTLGFALSSASLKIAPGGPEQVLVEYVIRPRSK
jgi:diadenylate cyclase